jgi:hypothetical protein
MIAVHRPLLGRIQREVSSLQQVCQARRRVRRQTEPTATCSHQPDAPTRGMGRGRPARSSPVPALARRVGVSSRRWAPVFLQDACSSDAIAVHRLGPDTVRNDGPAHASRASRASRNVVRTYPITLSESDAWAVAASRMRHRSASLRHSSAGCSLAPPGLAALSWASRHRWQIRHGGSGARAQAVAWRLRQPAPSSHPGCSQARPPREPLRS